MPFLDLPDRGLRMYLRIGQSDSSHDHLSPLDLLDPSKPSLVFCHAGASDGGRCFGGQLSDARLLQTYNLIALDLRYSGRTTEVPHRQTDLPLSELGKDAFSALLALNLDRYSLVGQGVVGCHTATWAAIYAPEKVQSLVLCSPCPIRPDEVQARSMVEEWMPAWREGDPACADFAEGYYFSNVGARFPVQRDAFMLAFAQRYTGKEGFADVRQILNYFSHTPIPPSLKRTLTCPILILSGGGDLTTSPPKAAKEWQEEFGDKAEWVNLNNAPHLVTYFEPNIASRMVLRFVGRAVAQQGGHKWVRKQPSEL